FGHGFTSSARDDSVIGFVRRHPPLDGHDRPNRTSKLLCFHTRMAEKRPVLAESFHHGIVQGTALTQSAILIVTRLAMYSHRQHRQRFTSLVKPCCSLVIALLIAIVHKPRYEFL